MKKIISLLFLPLLLAAAAACSDSKDGASDSQPGPSTDGFSIAIELQQIKATSARVVIRPSDAEETYCWFVVGQSEYRPANIPSDARYVTGDVDEPLTGLTLGTDYYVVVAAELVGYEHKQPFSTLGSSGVTDPEGHPDDFIIKQIPTKQRRSALRGVSGPLQMTDDASLLGKGVSWLYDWSHNYPPYCPQLDAEQMLFYPMVWNAGINREAILKYKSEHPEAQYLLAYNEPNLKDQANMTPSQAAAAWPQLKAVAQEAGLKIISPALNYGTLENYGDPVKWLDEFLTQPGVSPDDIAAIALHCYMPNVPGMRAMIHRFDKFQKPIYMTEFCHANGTITNDVSTQLSFMSEVLNYLETDPVVGGYSWFIARAGGSWSAISLLSSDASHQELTEAGRLYVNFSSFDKTCWYGPGEAIPAAHYVAHNMSGVAASEGWQSTFPVRPTTDQYGELMIIGNQTGAWVDYQIELPEARKYFLAVRYVAALMDGSFDLLLDGDPLATLTCPRSEVWRTQWIEVSLPQGRHTLRLKHREGRADINWLYLD